MRRMSSGPDRRTLLKLAAAAPLAAGLPSLAWAEGYEPPATLRPADALPPELLRGEHFEVTGDVIAQGFSNRYALWTAYATYDVVTQDELEKRIAETRAIGELLKVKQTDAFKAGFASALQSPYKGLKALVTRPVETISGVPRAVAKFGRRVGEMVSGDRGEQEDNLGAELLGFSTLKRKIAYKLGVDVYSSNTALQEHIDDVAYAGFAGGMAFKLAMIPVALPGAAAKALDAIKFTRRANQIMRDMAPEDLRLRNRKALEAMWVTQAEADAFMDNPHYTPRHETIITLALEGMPETGNRQAVIRRAIRVDSPLAAQLMQRSVEMMRSYHATAHPIVRVEELGDGIAYLTDDGGLAIAMPADRLHWTEWFDRTSRDLADYRAPGVRWRGVVVAGGLSPRARREAEQRGLLVEHDARAYLLPREEWVPPEDAEDPDGDPAPGAAAPAAEVVEPATGGEAPAGDGWQDVPDGPGAI
jgi:hypothetical protein